MTPRIKTLADVQPDILYAITELCPLIGASYTSLWREVRETGRLVGFDLAGGLRIRGSDFLAYFEACKLEPAARRREDTAPRREQSRGRPFKHLRVDLDGR